MRSRSYGKNSTQRLGRQPGDDENVRGATDDHLYLADFSWSLISTSLDTCVFNCYQAHLMPGAAPMRRSA